MHGEHAKGSPTTTAVRVFVKNVDAMKPRLTIQFPQTK